MTINVESELNAELVGWQWAEQFDTPEILQQHDDVQQRVILGDSSRMTLVVLTTIRVALRLHARGVEFTHV